MADWVIYTMDRAAERIAGTQVTSTQNAAYAPNVALVDRTSVYTRGASGTVTIYFDLGTSYSISAVAISGQVGGETFDVQSSTAFTGGSPTSRGQFTPAGNEPTLFTFSAASARYWRIVSTTSLSAAQYIEKISWLDDGEKYTLANCKVRLPFPDSLSPGYASSPHHGGIITQSNAGPSSQRQLVVEHVDLAESGDLGYDLRASYMANNAWRTGVWVTDYNFGSPTANQGKAIYGVPGPISAPQTHDPTRGTITIPIFELPPGVS